MSANGVLQFAALPANTEDHPGTDVHGVVDQPAGAPVEPASVDYAGATAALPCKSIKIGRAHV